MIVRPARAEDFEPAVTLYRQMGGAVTVIDGPEGARRWREIVDHPGTQVFTLELADSVLAALATLHVLPNMTFGGRPYALIENVVTGCKHRGMGYGRLVMQAAIDAAWAADAYKIMLLTGRNRPDGGVAGFYESLGFSSDDKHGMTLRRAPSRYAPAGGNSTK